MMRSHPWLCYWFLPVFSSVLFLVASLLAFSKGNPIAGKPAWCDDANVENICNGWSRDFICLYKTTCWFLAFCFDVLVSKRKWALCRGGCGGHELCPPILPSAQVALQCWRLMFAFAEIHVAFFATEDWNIPGLGLYGWSAAFAGFPGVTKETASHPFLAVFASIGFATLSRRKDSGVGMLMRLLYAALMVQSLNYPLWDIKHQCVGSHLSNAGTEYLPLYAVLSAASEFYREPPTAQERLQIESFAPRTSAGRLFTKLLDVHQAFLITLAMFRFTWQSFDGGPTSCWTAPDHYERLETKGEYPREFWANIVPWRINIGGAVFFFIFAESCVWFSS